VYGPALPTRADLAAAAREERDTQLTAINFKTNFQIKEAEQMLCILLLVKHVL
jgi:hypothetical protein